MLLLLCHATTSGRKVYSCSSNDDSDTLDPAIIIESSDNNGTFICAAQPARSHHILCLGDGADIQATTERKGVFLLPC